MRPIASVPYPQWWCLPPPWLVVVVNVLVLVIVVGAVLRLVEAGCDPQEAVGLVAGMGIVATSITRRMIKARRRSA